MAMTGKERIQAALAFEPVDRTPVYPLDGSSWVIKEENMNYEQLFALDDAGASLIVKHFNDLKADAITTGSSAWMAWTTSFGSSADLSKVGTTIAVKPGHDEVDEIPDMTNDEIRQALLQNPVVQAMIKQNKGVKALVGEDKALLTSVCGPLTGANGLIGADNLMVLIADADEELDKIMDFSSRCIAVLSEIYHEAGADYIVVCDPVSSGDMISLNMYKEVALPAFENYKKNVQGDIPFFVHICGKAGERNEYVRDLGAKAFSVDYMVDMEDMLKRADHKMCMMGNIAPSDQMFLGTPESVYAEATRLLELAYNNGGGLLLSTGCDLPAGSPLANVHAMVKAAEDFAAAHK
ncbi:MAG: hypothetical protein IIZ45_03005 [Firmicutes bacterium]|nr:hypothetical protein [Bacillota bacterium]